MQAADLPQGENHMGKKPEKTNAMRVLDREKVPYEPFYFSPEIHSATGVAEAVGIPANRVFKTLVVIRPKSHPLLVMVPGDKHLSLKKLESATSFKGLRMATLQEAEKLTGLKVGGISALALLGRRFYVYIDASALRFDEILVSAGKRGINIKLPVNELIRITKATPVEVAV